MGENNFSKEKHLIQKNRDGWFLVIIIGIMFAWKIILLIKNAFPFNSDEAIVALMAKHILSGERPVFFYGQAYMGSLDAYLTAFMFMLTVQKVFAIRIVQSLLYAFTILITYFIGKRAFQSSKAGGIAAILLALPTVNATLYTTVSLGGYGEAMLIGVSMLWLALGISNKISAEQPMQKPLFLMAFLSGFGLWVNGLSMVYIIPAWIYIFWMYFTAKQYERKLNHIFIPICGVLLGLFPILIFVIQNGIQSVWMELFGSAVSVEQANWFVRAGSHLLYLIIFGIPVMLGMRPPWSSELQLIWLIPLIFPLVFTMGFQLYTDLRRKACPDAVYLFLGVILLLFGMFIGTSFGVDPSGRYFVPLIIPAALLSGYALDRLIQKQWIIYGLVFAFLIYQGAVTWQLSEKTPYLTTQFYTPAMVNHQSDEELITFLTDNDLHYGYSNYWVSYPLAFLSDEKLIYVPALPYHPDLKFTERDNRYQPYADRVAASEEVNYIVTNNPELDEALRQVFTDNVIDYEYHEIGDFHIYYELSKTIRPNQFNLTDYSPK
jgi:4-amino-4-deoxy-L-arabinose transferase-like glycosyltransferase